MLVRKFVFMYVCMYVWTTYIFLSAILHTCTVCMYVFMYILYTYVVYMQLLISMFIIIRKCMYVCMNWSVLAYIRRSVCTPRRQSLCKWLQSWSDMLYAMCVCINIHTYIMRIMYRSTYSMYVCMYSYVMLVYKYN